MSDFFDEKKVYKPARQRETPINCDEALLLSKLSCRTLSARLGLYHQELTDPDLHDSQCGPLFRDFKKYVASLVDKPAHHPLAPQERLALIGQVLKTLRVCTETRAQGDGHYKNGLRAAALRRATINTVAVQAVDAALSAEVLGSPKLPKAAIWPEGWSLHRVPVDPNPPAPRAVSSSDASSRQLALS